VNPRLASLSRFFRRSVFSPNRASTLRRRRTIKTEERGRAATRRGAAAAIGVGGGEREVAGIERARRSASARGKRRDGEGGRRRGESVR